MSEVFGFLGGCIVVAALFGAVLHRLRPNWRRWRVAVISALPVPTIALAACLYLFVDAASASPEECGVDACGMVMMAAMVVGGFAIVGFALGLFVSAGILRLWWKP